VSKNLASYRSENNFADHQSDYVERLNVDEQSKSFNILATSLNVHNYFDDPNKILFWSVSS